MLTKFMDCVDMYKNYISVYKFYIYNMCEQLYLYYKLLKNYNMKTFIRKTTFIVGILLTFTGIGVFAQKYPKHEELSRTKANHILSDVWMRDPYIFIGPDQNYYLTYTNGKMEMPVWKSTNLKDWQKIGEKYTMKNLSYYNQLLEQQKELLKERKEAKLWAPEIYYINNTWVAVHTSNLKQSTIITSETPEFSTIMEPMKTEFGQNHDPSIFQDNDGKIWLIDKCAEIQQLKNDLSGFIGKPVKLNPANRKMGHEGCQIIKFGNKYVWFGTAWSKDELRKGTYNLYYATADKIEGPYSDRKFAGRCLGHGTVFKDKEGQWWCTAFLNGDYRSPSEVNKGVDPSVATSMNKQGLTLVPLSMKIIDGDVSVKALDPEYTNPGNEENQKF